MITYKFTLYPSKEQQKKLWNHANQLNWLYNYFLNQRIDAYKNKIKIGWLTQQAEIVSLREKYPNLSKIYSSSLREPVYRLDRTYKAFFRRVKRKEIAGFPKFRSCKNFFGIQYHKTGYKIKNSVLVTTAYGKIPFVQHREIQGKIKQVQITNKNNRWHVNITTDFSEKQDKASGSVGIDIGLKNLIVATDGTKIENCTHAKYFDKQISILQSRMDKLKKGSRKNKYLRKVINRLYDVECRKINDFQHKVSKKLSQKYDTIYAEDLSVKKMSESNKTGLNKAIRNAKFAQFLLFLKYKTNNLILVNPYNTSKTCNHCGFINESLRLSDREITCSSCKEKYDRDENAAKNIFCLGQAINSGLCSEKVTIQEVLNKRST
jgi:putative transposase